VEFYTKEKLREYKETLDELRAKIDDHEKRLVTINNKILIIYILLILKVLESKEQLKSLIQLMK
jgi:hypothetical protein